MILNRFKNIKLSTQLSEILPGKAADATVSKILNDKIDQQPKLSTSLNEIETGKAADATSISALKGIMDNIVGIGDVSKLLTRQNAINSYFPNLCHLPFDDSIYARQAVSTLAFAGSTFYVDSSKADDSGNGLTPGTAKKTITAAYNLAANGDNIQLADGTYNLSNEASSYLLLNTHNKGVCIKGNASDKSAVILSQATGTYALRFRDCGSIKVKDLTISVQSTVLPASADANASYGNANVLFNNVVFTHTGTGAIYSRAGVALTDTLPYYTEFVNCTFNLQNYTANNSIVIGNHPATSSFLFKGCTFNSKNQYGINCGVSTYAKLYIYDNTVNMSGNYVGIQVGTDTATPTIDFSLMDIRNNSINYSENYNSHGLLIGRGIKNCYCFNNKITIPENTSALAIGIVVKSTPAAIGNVKIYGNYVVSPRPFYIKGASKNDVRYNTFICNTSIYAPFSFINYLDGSTNVLSSLNNVSNNNFIGLLRAINIDTTSGTSESETVTIKTNTLSDNKYYLTTNYIEIQGGSNYTWENRANFWSPANDLNSVKLNENNLPIRLI